MSDPRPSSSDSGKPPGSSRGRSYSSSSRRGSTSTRPPPNQTFHPYVNPYSQMQDQQNMQPAYPGQYTTPSTPYTQRGPYGGGQYTISPPLPPVSVAGQQAGLPFSYPSHPSLVAIDSSMQPHNPLMAYSPTSLVPMPHTPVYTYPAHSPETTSPANQPYGSAATSMSSLYSSAPSSHTLLSTPGTSQALTPSYPTPQYGNTAQYPTPSFVYPPHSYAHSGNTVYQGQYSYGQQYAPPVPAEQETQGTWWYLPPGTRPAPSPHYHALTVPFRMLEFVLRRSAATPLCPYLSLISFPSSGHFSRRKRLMAHILC